MKKRLFKYKNTHSTTYLLSALLLRHWDRCDELEGVSRNSRPRESGQGEWQTRDATSVTVYVTVNENTAKGKTELYQRKGSHLFLCPAWLPFSFSAGGGGEGFVSQGCLALSSPVDCSLPASSVHGLLQARTLE